MTCASYDSTGTITSLNIKTAAHIKQSEYNVSYIKWSIHKKNQRRKWKLL